MFNEIARKLPAYENHVEQLRSLLAAQGRTISSRLVHALANVYADLIRFCHPSIRLFSAKRSGMYCAYIPLTFPPLMSPS